MIYLIFDIWYFWYLEDFRFIGIEMKEDKICLIPKSEYKQQIKALIRNAAFGYFNVIKSKHKKFDCIIYSSFKIQPYLTSSQFSNKEREFLYLLRSHWYKSKTNFKKLHKNDLVCIFGCPIIEDQHHIFTNCEPIKVKLNITEPVQYEYIFGTVEDQQKVISTLMLIEETRQHTKQHLSPGGVCSQDLCTFSTSLYYAADNNL